MCIRCKKGSDDKAVYIEEFEDYLCQNCIEDEDVEEYGLTKCKKCHNWKLNEDFYQKPVGGTVIECVCIDCLRTIFDIEKCPKCNKYKKSNRLSNVPTLYLPILVCDDCLDENDRKGISKKEFNKPYLLIVILAFIGGIMVLGTLGDILNNLFNLFIDPLPGYVLPLLIPVFFILVNISQWIKDRFF